MYMQTDYRRREGGLMYMQTVKSTILCKDFHSTIKLSEIGSDVCLPAMAGRQILLLFRGLTEKSVATGQHIFMFIHQHCANQSNRGCHVRKDTNHILPPADFFVNTFQTVGCTNMLLMKLWHYQVLHNSIKPFVQFSYSLVELGITTDDGFKVYFVLIGI